LGPGGKIEKSTRGGSIAQRETRGETATRFKGPESKGDLKMEKKKEGDCTLQKEREVNDQYKERSSNEKIFPPKRKGGKTSERRGEAKKVLHQGLGWQLSLGKFRKGRQAKLKGHVVPPGKNGKKTSRKIITERSEKNPRPKRRRGRVYVTRTGPPPGPRTRRKGPPQGQG